MRQPIRTKCLAFFLLLPLATLLPLPCTVRPAAHAEGAQLTLGVVQLALEPDLAANRDKMLRFLKDAKAKGCRVVVFPETALYSPPQTPKADVDAAIAELQKAAKTHGVYVIFCVKYQRDGKERPFERLIVIDPQGNIIHVYDKLWSDARFNNVPGTFLIDGIPCCATICADRWIRGVEELPALKNAQVLFECSNNYDNEWIDDLGWYWYVPRALRNNAYVIFANTAKTNRTGNRQGHGHSAVIAPDGAVLTFAGEESDVLLVVTIDPAKATRAEAEKRRNHPVFKPFWDVGLDILDGKRGEVADFKPLTSPQVTLQIAAAQLACSQELRDNVVRMKHMMRTASRKGADVIVFPELAVTGARQADILKADEAALKDALSELQDAARQEKIHVVFGMPWLQDGKRFNCAFVVAPDRTVLTRYAQVVVDRPELFTPGTSPKTRWFQIKGVPGVVTIGAEALWSEIAELAAVRGAQLHLHLAYDRDTSKAGQLRRKQLWANLASFRTFTATVNAALPGHLPQPSEPAMGGSALWEDYHRASKGAAGGYFPHSAVRLAEAGADEEILYAMQTVQATNPHFGLMTGRTNPQMKPWYQAGAHVIAGEKPAGVKSVERWDTHEITLTSRKQYANPFRDAELTSVFTHSDSGKQLTVPGFHDGGQTWRVRFLPLELGKWSYVTKSSDPDLDGKRGEVLCVKTTKPYLHGPLRTDGYHFVHADGTRRFLISTRLSCQFAEPVVRREVIALLKDAGINRVLFIIGGVHGTVKDLFGPGPDFWRYDVKKWQAVDAFIDELRQHDILAAPYFYYFNDGMQGKMTMEQDRVFLRYGMARFGAYANVLPVLANEVEQKFTLRRDPAYNLKSHAWANEMGPLLKQLAVFGQPVTVHNPMESDRAVKPGFYTLLKEWPFPWADYMLRQLQVGAVGGPPELRDDVPEVKTPTYNDRAYARHNQLLIDLRKYKVPIINEEPGYEMGGLSWDGKKRDPRSWNSQTADTLCATFWTATTAGAYCMWGSPGTYDLVDPRAALKAGGTPKVLRVLADVMGRVPYWEMKPANDVVNPNPVMIDGVAYRTNFALAKPGAWYLIYSRHGGVVEVSLPKMNFEVLKIDPLARVPTIIDLWRGGPFRREWEVGQQAVLLIRPQE